MSDDVNTATATRTKYEYKLLPMLPHSRMLNTEVMNSEELNKHGRDGWEMCGTWQSMYIVLKRELV